MFDADALYALRMFRATIIWIWALARWILEAWPLWVPFAVISAVAFGALWIPGSPEDRIRHTGMCLEIFGILTVAAGIREKRQLFNKPSILEFVFAWVRRAPRWNPKQQSIYASGVGSAGGVGSASAFGWSGVSPNATLEERVAALERNVEAVHRVAVDAQNQVRAEAAKRKTELEHEKQLRESADQEIRARLELFAAGNLNIEWVGIVWLLLGVVLATASKEVASLFV